MPPRQYSACFGAARSTIRSISNKTWDEIYELVGRIQHRAIESQDWEIAKDADRVNVILRKLPEETVPQEARSS